MPQRHKVTKKGSLAFLHLVTSCLCGKENTSTAFPVIECNYDFLLLRLYTIRSNFLYFAPVIKLIKVASRNKGDPFIIFNKLRCSVDHYFVFLGNNIEYGKVGGYCMEITCHQLAVGNDIFLASKAILFHNFPHRIICNVVVHFIKFSGGKRFSNFCFGHLMIVVEKSGKIRGLV